MWSLLNMHLCALPGESKFPFLVSIGLGSFLSSTIVSWQNGLFFPWLFALVCSLFVFFLWMSDLSAESNYVGEHTLKVQNALKLGMILFIFSEIMFFFGFFWTILHFSLNPSGDVGFDFPASGIFSLDSVSIPLLNTVILVSSGVTLTIAHQCALTGKGTCCFLYLLATIGMGIMFFIFQLTEYYTCSFSISSCNYGSIFFTSTGFHGGHVIFGAILLVVCIKGLVDYKLYEWHHSMLEMSAWYWHFVDVVWLFLFSLLYWWGG